MVLQRQNLFPPHCIFLFPSRDFMLQGLVQIFHGLQLLYQGLEHKFQALQQKIVLGAGKFVALKGKKLL